MLRPYSGARYNHIFQFLTKTPLADLMPVSCYEHLLTSCVGGSNAGFQRFDTLLLRGRNLQYEGIERRERRWYNDTILFTEDFPRYSSGLTYHLVISI